MLFTCGLYLRAVEKRTIDALLKGQFSSLQLASQRLSLDAQLTKATITRKGVEKRARSSMEQDILKIGSLSNHITAHSSTMCTLEEILADYINVCVRVICLKMF